VLYFDFANGLINVIPMVLLGSTILAYITYPFTIIVFKRVATFKCSSGVQTNNKFSLTSRVIASIFPCLISALIPMFVVFSLSLIERILRYNQSPSIVKQLSLEVINNEIFPFFLKVSPVLILSFFITLLFFAVRPQRDENENY
jgi:hypothetical protein